MLILVPTRGEATRLFSGDPPEAGVPGLCHLGGARVRAALCGFGPAASGVLASQALVRSGARDCLLLGIAGTYRPDRLAVGGLLRATEVRTADIGRGRGGAFVGPADAGFAQAPAGGGAEPVIDRIALGSGPGDGVLEAVEGVLLTVASAAATPEEARGRLEAHPDALAEDMEAFAVALACRRFGARFGVLRGISNVVGEPDPRRWERDRAMLAVRAAAIRLMESARA